MNRFVKLAAVVGLVACGVAIVSESRGAVIVVPPGVNNDYHYQTTVSDWSSVPTIETQDKDWTWLSNDSSSIANAPVQFSLQNLGGIDNHKLQLGDFNGFTFTTGSYDLKYEISVIPTSPNVFANVTLGVDLTVGSTATTVTKLIYSDAAMTNLVATLTNVDGLVASLVPLNNAIGSVYGLKALYVDEQINVGTAAAINSTTDTYTETTVPEPASLIVWSVLGVAGVGMTLWRKRKVA